MGENSELTVGELLDLLERLEVDRDALIYVEREAFGEEGTYVDVCPSATVELTTNGHQRVVVHIE